MFYLLSILLKRFLSDRDLEIARAFDIYVSILPAEKVSPEIQEDVAKYSFEAARAFGNVAKDETLGVEDLPKVLHGKID